MLGHRFFPLCILSYTPLGIWSEYALASRVESDPIHLWHDRMRTLGTGGLFPQKYTRRFLTHENICYHALAGDDTRIRLVSDGTRIDLCEGLFAKDSLSPCCIFLGNYSSLAILTHDILIFSRRDFAYSLIDCWIFLRGIDRRVPQASLECWTHRETVPIHAQGPPRLYVLHHAWIRLCREYPLSDTGISIWDLFSHSHGNQSIIFLTAGTPSFCRYLCHVLVEGAFLWCILVQV